MINMDIQEKLQNFMIEDSAWKGKINQSLNNIDSHLTILNGAVQENLKFRLTYQKLLEHLPTWQEEFVSKYAKLSPKIIIIIGALTFLAGFFLDFIKDFILSR